ncbi:hypothetical protein [Ascidiimonas aurantiaca]|uniref:hypothetical protein n=1 Tax=Ascidiimonas aurantiaca TaxID=1685432 RepID=UPI0030ED0134
MSNMLEIVDSLENRVSKLLHKMEVLKQSNEMLTRELAVSKRSIANHQKEIEEWKEKYRALKMANSMLGSNEKTTEAKLTINTLIREIDRCIAQLSE